MKTQTQIERLQIVRQFNKLNFNDSQELKDIVKLATNICHVPVAMITLMDEDRQLIR
jgi:hypothetical protein